MTMSFMIPAQVSHKAHAYKKECLMDERRRVCSHLRAPGLSMLHWGFLVTPLYLSIRKQTSHGFGGKYSGKVTQAVS